MRNARVTLQEVCGGNACHLAACGGSPAQVRGISWELWEMLQDPVQKSMDGLIQTCSAVPPGYLLS